MNDRQNAKLNMAQRVSDTFKRNQASYTNISPMVSAVSELNAHIANIREVQKEHVEVNIPAASLEKRLAERQMIEQSVKMINALYVIGFTTNNNELITLQSISESSFYNSTNNASLALARRILDLTRQYASELVNYGITQTEITSLETAISNFHSLISKPMDTIGERKQKTTNLAQLFASLDSIFYDKLDKLMVLFKKTNPEFYGEYRTARNIIFNNE
jgi:hypothetical protein